MFINIHRILSLYIVNFLFFIIITFGIKINSCSVKDSFIYAQDSWERQGISDGKG